MHTTIRRPGRRITALAATAAASALAVTSLAAPAMAAEGTGPIGKEASDGSWLGPYMTPTEDGDQLGWAVDPGLPEPKADGNTENYGEPEAWEGLTDEQRLQLVAALYFGDKAVEADEAGEEVVDDEFAEELLGTTDVDDIAAGVAGIISSVSVDKPVEGAVWDPQVLDEDANEVYTNLLNGPGTATDVDVSDIEFLLRSPGGEAEGNTRVLLTSDMDLPWAADDSAGENTGGDDSSDGSGDEGIIDEPGTINIETLDADGKPLEGVGYEIRKVGEDGNLDNPLSKFTSGSDLEESTQFAGTYNLRSTNVPDGLQGEVDENFEVGIGEEVDITVTFSEDADPVVEIVNSSETEDEPEVVGGDGPGNDESEAPSEDEETDEAPVAEVDDDVQRKAPVEHHKKPTGDQDRATIVSVPSGPTGENPLA